MIVGSGFGLGLFGVSDGLGGFGVGFGSGFGIDFDLSSLIRRSPCVKMEEINNYQQGLVLEQRYKLLEYLVNANSNLDSKASALLQTGGVVVGLVAATSLPSFAQLIRSSSFTSTLASQFSISIALLLFLASIWLYRDALSPRGYGVPGSSDWDETFNNYLYAKPVACFDKVLVDLLRAIKTNEELNHKKAELVTRLGWLLLVQVFFVAIAIIAAG